MGTALTVVIMFSLSVFIIRLATVSLRLTGLSHQVAKFQALSAFSGSGFTSLETEQVVNYPVRRKIITYLMVVGNLGLVAMLSTVVVGFVNTEGDALSIFHHLVWLIGGLLLIWFVLLNPFSEELMCSLMSKVLSSMTELGGIPYQRLLQVGEHWSIAEHKLTFGALKQKISIETLLSRLNNTQILALTYANGETTPTPPMDHILEAGDAVVLFACEEEHKNVAAILVGQSV